MSLASGRFVLIHGVDVYVTSWDEWESCEAAFPIEHGYRLRDDETGREWLPGSKFDWEAART